MPGRLIVAGSALAAARRTHPQPATVFAVGLGLALFGLMLVPLRGWFLRKAYERRLYKARDEYLNMLRRAASEMVGAWHPAPPRRDAPFTRLIESQTELLERASHRFGESPADTDPDSRWAGRCWKAASRIRRRMNV